MLPLMRYMLATKAELFSTIAPLHTSGKRDAIAGSAPVAATGADVADPNGSGTDTLVPVGPDPECR